MGLIPALKTFVPNTPILSSEVNSNFSSIRDVVNGNIDGTNIKNGSVQGDIIADEAITTNKLENLSVTHNKIANGVVSELKITDGAVKTEKLGTGAVTSIKIDNGAVTEDKIDNGAVTDIKLASGINASKITAGVMSGARISTGSVSLNRLAYEDLTGVVGKPAIGAGPVSFLVSPTNSVLRRAGGQLGFGTIDSDHISGGAVTEPKLASDAVRTVKIADGAVTPSKTSFMVGTTMISTGKVSATGNVYQGSLPSNVNLTRPSTGVYRFEFTSSSERQRWGIQVTPVESPPDILYSVNETSQYLNVEFGDSSGPRNSPFNFILVSS